MSTGDRLSVRLTSRALAALGAVEQRTGDSTTDTVNRALQVYAALTEQAERAGVTVIEIPWDAAGPLHLLISRQPIERESKRRWRPW